MTAEKNITYDKKLVLWSPFSGIGFRNTLNLLHCCEVKLIIIHAFGVFSLILLIKMRVIILLVVFYILLDSSTARIRNLKIKQAENTDLSRMQDSSNFKRITSKLQSLKINKSGSHDIRHIRSNSTRNPTMTAKENGKDRRHRNLELRKKTNRTLLRLTMQHMFGFNQASTRQRNETSFANENDVNQNLFHDQTVRTAPPDFIMERFRVYTKDSDFSLQESTTQGNTIRSFYPITGGLLYAL